MVARRNRRQRAPLDAETLNELALTYVGRFATTRAKLASYLSRKVRERGWDGSPAPDFEGIAERLAGLGYVDDAAYALGKARSLTARGYGVRRVSQTLRAAGIAEEDSAEARDLAEREAVESALRFARRRRIGPYGDGRADHAETERALAAMIRAGHGFPLAKAILRLEPGRDIDPDTLIERA
jgi:regulatory protein